MRVIKNGRTRAAVRQAAATADREPAVPLDVADSVIQRLFQVGLTLSSCAGLMEGPAAAPVRHATDGLDQVIGDLRTAIFDQHQRAGPTSSPSPDRALLVSGATAPSAAETTGRTRPRRRGRVLPIHPPPEPELGVR